MLFGNPWGLLALLALPAILAIHLFRRRYPERPHSALFLWGASAHRDTSGARRERLRRRLSLLAELLAALALSILLSDPHLRTSVPAVHHIWLLDSHARLQAEDAGVSVLTRLRAAVDERLADLSEQDRVSLVVSAAGGRLLAHQASPEAARAALAQWQASSGVHSLEPARRLVLELGDANSRRALASDRPLPEIPDWGLLCLGRAIAQSGLTAAFWHREETGDHLFLHCHNSGAARERLLLLGEQQYRLQLPQGASTHRLELPEPPQSLELRFADNDSFIVDDAVTLLRPTAPRVRVRDRSGSPVLRRALQAVAAVELVDADEHLGFDTRAWPADAERWQVQIVPNDHSQVGPFLARRAHPLLRDLSTAGLLWVGGSDDPSQEVLLAAGERVLIDQPGPEQLRLFADLERSHFDRHPAWPSLIHNLIHWRASRLPGPARLSIAAGQAAVCQLATAHARALLQAPDGAIHELQADADGALVLPELEAGRWQLRDAQEQLVSEIAVHRLSPEMSDFSRALTSNREPAAVNDSMVARQRGRWSWIIPAVLATLAALLAWHAFAREEGLAR